MKSLHNSSSRPKYIHLRSICKTGIFEHKVHIEYFAYVRLEYIHVRCMCKAGVFDHEVHTVYKAQVIWRTDGSSRLKYLFVRYIWRLNVWMCPARILECRIMWEECQTSFPGTRKSLGMKLRCIISVYETQVVISSLCLARSVLELLCGVWGWSNSSESHHHHERKNHVH